MGASSVGERDDLITRRLGSGDSTSRSPEDRQLAVQLCVTVCVFFNVTEEDFFGSHLCLCLEFAVFGISSGRLPPTRQQR